MGMMSGRWIDDTLRLLGLVLIGTIVLFLMIPIVVTAILTATVDVTLDETGTPTVYGWGRDADDIHAIGLLHLGASWLALHEVKRK